MAPELVAGGGYGSLIREKPHCALVSNQSPLIPVLLLFGSMLCVMCIGR